MLLERKQRENPEKYREPNFHPRYRQTLPPGLGVKQVSSIMNSEKSQRLGALSITFKVLNICATNIVEFFKYFFASEIDFYEL